MSELTLILGGRQSGKSTYIRENAPLNRLVLYPNMPMARYGFQNTVEAELHRIKSTSRTPFRINYDNGDYSLFSTAHEQHYEDAIIFGVVGSPIRTVIVEEAQALPNWVLYGIRFYVHRYNLDVWLTITPEIVDTSKPLPMWFTFAQAFAKPATFVHLTPNYEMINRVRNDYNTKYILPELHGEIIVI